MNRRNRATIRGPVAGVVTIVAALGGLGLSPALRVEPPLEPVPQGTVDANPLAAPANVQPLDLRLPLGFDRVFRVVEPGRSMLNQRYARSSGAITAVFPRSQYTPTRDGVIPEIPAGTIFYIGGLPDDLFSSPPPAIRRGPTYVDRSVRAVPSAAESAASPAETPARLGDRVARREIVERPAPVSIMTDEGFRQARVCELIDRAAESLPPIGAP
ncbi:MAG: hypothetical protein IT434_10515 [Phycisphaerales bacterium]|jgi:hypothetical protein|nr:hypothetical protein [Phycisphaerales bacterium]